MATETSIAPLREQIEAELDLVVVTGLWDAKSDQTEQLRSLSIFGGTPGAPARLDAFQPAFRDFLKTNEELAGALSDMAIRLYGAEQPWREMSQEGRLEAFGEVVWRGKQNTLETTRRREGKRRRELRELASKAIALAEARFHESSATPVADPPEALASRAPSEPQLDVDSPESRREDAPSRRMRLAAGIAVVVVLAISAGVVATLGVFGGNGAPMVPREGSVTDASSGRVYRPGQPLRIPGGSSGAIEAGNFLHGCDEALAPCSSASSWADVPVARAGDTLRFRALLKNRFNAPIAFIRVTATWEKGEFSVNLYWARGPNQHGTDVADVLQVNFTDNQTHQLVYVPGSTRLYTANHGLPATLLTPLPDGIMASNGILLVDFGPPSSCFECINGYARIIELSTRVS